MARKRKKSKTNPIEAPKPTGGDIAKPLLTEQQLLAGLKSQGNSSMGLIERLLSEAATIGLQPPPIKRITKKKAKRRAKLDLDLLRKWEGWADELLYWISPKFDFGEIDYSVRFTIESVSADGIIVAKYELFHSREEYRLFVNLTPKAERRCGCTCIDSIGGRPCVHTFTFADWLSQMLVEPIHELSQMIATKTFSAQPPDLDSIGKPDKKTIQTFIDQRLPKASQSQVADPASLTGMEVATAAAARLCWDLVTFDDDVELQLRIQSAKKRGVGWTKGKRLNSSNFHQYLSTASEIDRKIISQLDQNRLQQSKSLSFNIVEALHDLIGQPNVLLNGKPVEIIRFQPELEYYQTQEICGVRLRNSSGVASKRLLLLTSGDKILEVDESVDHLRVAKLPSNSTDAWRAILKLPQLPLIGSEKLIERLKTYRNILAIHLPDDGQDPPTPEKTTSVLLLRSRKNGVLDYGFRARGSHDNLYVPGFGPNVVETCVGKGKKKSQISLIRDGAQELDQAIRLADQLQIPSEPMEGSIADFEQALDLIGIAQQMESAGDLEVLWDKESIEPVQVLGTVTAKGLRVEVAADRDWFQLKGKCELSGGALDLSELLAGIGSGDSNGQYIQFGKQGWAKVSKQLRSQLNRLADTVSRDRKKLNFDASSVPTLQEILPEKGQIKATKKWNECLARIDRAKNLVPKVPKSLNADLRDYQKEGFSWLRRLAEWGVGGILADDMGLGKTLQALAVLLDRAGNGPALVVAPTSVGFNWKSEAERFAPGLNAHLYRETDRDEFLGKLGPQDLVVCSYGLMLRDEKKLSQIQWSTMVLDEAQAVKNNRSKTAIAAKKIPAQWKLALTGTPMENHLGELWSIFNVVAPGVFGGWENFRTRFANPIERNQDDQRRIALRDRIQPFVLRRTKSEVLKDLPPRTEQNITIELSAKERAIYDRVRLSAIGEMDEIANLPQVQDQRFRLLALLTRLRQLACSPKLVQEEWAERSTKLQQLAETVQSLKREGHRVLIFSQFVKHLELIRAMLTEEEITFEYLDGSTPASARRDRVERFQTGDATAFLISLKAGGTGLNLTAADYVIHMDPWWNPAVEDQATDRAHRIGQQRPVMCYRLVAKGTIEEEILKLHATKRDLVAGVLEGSSAAAKLTTNDLVDLIRGAK